MSDLRSLSVHFFVGRQAQGVLSCLYIYTIYNILFCDFIFIQLCNIWFTSVLIGDFFMLSYTYNFFFGFAQGVFFYLFCFASSSHLPLTTPCILCLRTPIQKIFNLIFQLCFFIISSIFVLLLFYFMIYFSSVMSVMISFSYCMHAKLCQLCPTFCDSLDCSPPDSSVHGILQARILEWVVMLSSR